MLRKNSSSPPVVVFDFFWHFIFSFNHFFSTFSFFFQGVFYCFFGTPFKNILFLQRYINDLIGLDSFFSYYYNNELLAQNHKYSRGLIVLSCSSKLLTSCVRSTINILITIPIDILETIHKQPINITQTSYEHHTNIL